MPEQKFFSQSLNPEFIEDKTIFESIIQGIQDGVTLTTPDGKIVFANEIAAKISGLSSAKEMMSKTVSEVSSKFALMSEDGKKLSTKELPNRKAIQGDNVPETVIRFIDKEGNEKWARVKSTPIFDKNGKIKFSVNVFHDFTAQKLIRIEMEESEKKFRFLADSIPQIVWTANPDGIGDYFNKKWYDYTGIKKTTDFNKEWITVIHPEDNKKAKLKWKKSVKNGTDFEYEYRLKNININVYKWYLARAIPYKNEKGEIIKWFGTFTDIQDQKRGEEQQRFISEASRLLSTTLDYHTTLKNISDMAVPDIADWVSINLIDDDGKLKQLVVSHVDPKKVEFAKEFQKQFPPDPNASTGVYNVIKTGKAELIPYISTEMIKNAITDPKLLRILEELDLSSIMTIPLIGRDNILGAITFISAESKRYYDEKDLKFAQSVADRASMAIDNSKLYLDAQKEIEERIKVEKELRESELKFRYLSDNAPVLIWMSGADSKRHFFNKTWLDFTGRTLEQEKGNGWKENVHPDDIDRFMKTHNKAFKAEKKFKIEYRLKRYDGEYRWILSAGTPRLNADGTFAGYIGSCIDITEKKLSNTKLKSSLYEKEVLLKEIHHRVKNNLQVISSLLSLQSISIKDPALLEIFKDCQSRIRSMALIHKNLYQSGDLAHVNFADYIESLTTSLKHSFIIDEDKVKLKVEVDNVSVDIDQAIPLGLIINELLSNCFKYAFPNYMKGKIDVSLKHKNSENILIIKDNGIGLPKNIDIENTESMGLQLVNILTRQLGGNVVLSRKKGTEFIITFPESKK